MQEEFGLNSLSMGLSICASTPRRQPQPYIAARSWAAKLSTASLPSPGLQPCAMLHLLRHLTQTSVLPRSPPSRLCGWRIYGRDSNINDQAIICHGKRTQINTTNDERTTPRNYANWSLKMRGLPDLFRQLCGQPAQA